MITQERLKELLHYCPETGVFTWLDYIGRVNNQTKPGDTAGSLDKLSGYIRITVLGKAYRAHRLAFLYMTGSFPKDNTDHVNQVKHDNRWENIRDVTQAENTKNISMHKDNKSGFTGVYWCKRSIKWVSCVRVEGKLKNLGYFISLDKAIEARKKANIKYGFHPNHGQSSSTTMR